MNRKVLVTGIAGLFLLLGTVNGHAEKWLKIKFDVPNKNLETNYYDADSIKARGKTIHWTEKFVLTDFGEKSYSKYLMQYPECRKNIEEYGTVAYHKIDFEIKEGKYRTVAKRNYTKSNKLLCTDKEMGTEFDRKWYEIEYKSPIYERHYLLVSKYKMGNL
jgi:hypothetical protein